MTRLAFAVLAALFSVACDNPASTVSRSYWAPLTGASEVPSNNSPALGQAFFQLNAAGTVLTYRLETGSITNVTMAHIHLAPEGANGDIVQFLFGPVAAGAGERTGEISSGSIDGSQFVGPLAGRPFSELIAAIDAGNAYVNVHTNDGVPPPSNTPGDVPTGEIRGQIRLAQ